MNLHPEFLGPTLLGDNTKENVARFLSGGHILDAEGWVHGPKVIRTPIPEAFTQPLITPELVILHSNAAPSYTRAERLIAFWRRADINGEAHLQLDLNGTGYQAIPVSRRADCNYKVNSFFKNGKRCGAISWETADNGAATLPVTPWNMDMLDTLISFNFLFCAAYKIGCGACPSPFSTGIDYHSKFREWSSFTGKTCPGASRIRQMDYVRTEVASRLAEYYRQCGGACRGS